MQDTPKIPAMDFRGYLNKDTEENIKVEVMCRNISLNSYSIMELVPEILSIKS